ncbi:MAG: kynureninase [Fimbriimonas sp.]
MEFRERFVMGPDSEIYLKGNSLGRLPKRTIEVTQEVTVAQWGERGVRAWNEGWYDAPLRIGSKIARLVGASSDEVIVCDSTSVNLAKLAWASLARDPNRPDILTDDTNFPSDYYVLAEVARKFGGELRIVPTSDLASSLDDSVGLLALSHVAFKSGELLDMAGLTSLAHSRGALALWDLSHSVGALPVELNRCGADLAVGCTYKYLNGGPGAPAFLYVRSDLVEELSNPLPGWFGHARPFQFETEYESAPGLRRFLSGTPPILSLMAVEVGVDIALEAGIDWIREHSLELTQALRDGLRDSGLAIQTPEGSNRGSHIAISHPEAFRISRVLLAQGIVCDFREPDTLRFGFSALYNTLAEAEESARAVVEVLRTESYRSIPEDRPSVT